MASDPSEHGSLRPIEEEVESHTPAPASSRGQTSRSQEIESKNKIPNLLNKNQCESITELKELHS